MSTGPARMLKSSAFKAASLLGVPALCRYLNRDKLLIVMYHAVVPMERPYELWTHVHVDEFRDQIRLLKKHYHLLPLREALAALDLGQPLPPNSAVLTFDDGFENNYSCAFPVLQEENVPATIFLATGFIDSQNLNWPDRLYLLLLGTAQPYLDLSDRGFGVFDIRDGAGRSKTFSDLLMVLKSSAEASKNELLAEIDARIGPLDTLTQRYWHDFAPMTWDQAREMQASGLIDFGAHTVNHEILSRLSGDKIKKEIVTSCERVTEMLGIDAPVFAYPNGSAADFDENALAVLRELDLPCALTTIDRLCRKDDDVYELPRVGIGSDMTLSRFELACSGLLSSCKNLFTR